MVEQRIENPRVGGSIPPQATKICKRVSVRVAANPFCIWRARAMNATLPAVRGGLLALLAATLFGISTPLVQRAGAGLGPFTTAALLYAGAEIREKSQ